MIVTSSGGLCSGPCRNTIDNLYENGKFGDFKPLSSSEILKLKNIIETTDFLMYASNSNPNCQSFVDGSDQVLLFPQKYGNKTFIPCKLDIPKNDVAFSYIYQLLKSHSNQQ